MDQDNLIRRIKIARMQDQDFSYEDLAQMIDLKLSSFYNFMNKQYKIKQSKAKMLSDWLSDRDQ